MEEREYKKYSLRFKLDVHFKKNHTGKIDVHNLIALNDQNMWSEIDTGNINKRYVE